MNLASMLQQGGGMPPQGGAPSPSGPMQPEQAIQILQQFGISEQDLPMIVQAVQALMGGQAEPAPPQEPPMPMPPG